MLIRSIVAVLVLGFSALIAAGQQLYVDGANSQQNWSVAPSTGVKAEIVVSPRTLADGSTTRAVTLTYDFQKQAGYCIVRLPLDIPLPESFNISFTAAASGATNNLECKLVDGKLAGAAANPVGDNVWWYVHRPLRPGEPRLFTLPARLFSFAWGPGGDKARLTQLGAFEFALTASEGGSGTVEFTDFKIVALPSLTAYIGVPLVTASSQMCVLHEPANLVDQDPATAWQSDADDYAGDESTTLQYDFGAEHSPRGFGGVTIEWESGFAPRSFSAFASDDGQTWSTLATDRPVSQPSRSLLVLGDTYARFFKLTMKPDAQTKAAGVQQLKFEPIGFADSANSLIQSISNSSPPGSFPRSLSGEQAYWTVVGIPGDRLEAIVSEDGIVEPFKGEFSIEPFIIQPAAEGQTPTISGWAGATHTQSLANNILPLPSVVRTHEGLDLATTFVNEGAIDDSSLVVCYEVTNTSALPKSGTLLLAVRPLQVLPPWQRLNIEGGAGRISSVAFTPAATGTPAILTLNDNRSLVFFTPPREVRHATFDDGLLPSDLLAAGDIQTARSTQAPQQSPLLKDLQSVAVTFDFALDPQTSRRWWVVIPLHSPKIPTRLLDGLSQPDAFFQRVCGKIADTWMKLLMRTRIHLPAEAQPLLETWYASAAYILINMDGPAFQPGSRTYERSWIRDGALTSAAMLEAGFPELAKPFLSWYGNFQYDFGKIPCVVDQRGADPVDEHDSTGQYIFAVWNYYKFTKDEPFLLASFPRIAKGVNYLEHLVALRSTPAFTAAGQPRQEPGKPPVPALAFFGMVPESISHEGYSAKPMHSYWDNFFTLAGFDAAIDIARILNKDTQANLWKRSRDTFATNLRTSIAATQAAHGIDYIPGCVELGDFDSTSTTIALWPTNAADFVPQTALTATFDRYWREHTSRVKSQTWEAYTPYELRHIGALTRLGQRDRALEALDWYMTHQRPRPWRQWQEVVWRDERATKFIGDSPHTWCASDFMNSFRSLFMYERASDQSLVLLAGVPEVWVRDEGVAFQDLPSHYGKLGCRVIKSKNQFTVTLVGDASVPPGGFAVTCPGNSPVERASVNGKAALLSPRGEVLVFELPAKVEITTLKP